jgi:type I restriction enzyme S subunit
MIELSPRHRQMVEAILRTHVPDRRVRVFGSRVQGRARRFSDLDLVILGERPLSDRARFALETAFDESDLPFRVDVVDWAKLDDAFRAAIGAAAEDLMPPPATASPAAATTDNPAAAGSAASPAPAPDRA